MSKNNKRTLQELNLLDDFLFGSVACYPEIGETVSRLILEIILQKKLGKITIIPQKVYYGSDTTLHGTRLDVYVEEDCSDSDAIQNAVIYDLEPENKDKKLSISSLPQRVRFYHSKIDARCLNSGESYESLKQVYVIMIMCFDPFGKDHMVYTISNHIKELPDYPYEDGAKTIFLYTKGHFGIPSQELKELLSYMENSTLQNACNPTLRNIHNMVDIVKHDKEVSIEYMHAKEREEYFIQQGRKEAEEEIQKLTETNKKLLNQNLQQEEEIQTLNTQNRKLAEDIQTLKEEFESLKKGFIPQ